MEKANGCYVSFSGKGCGNETAETTLNRLLSLNLKQIQDYYCCRTRRRFSRNVLRIEFWIRHLSTCTQVVLPSAYIVFALHIEALLENNIDLQKQQY